MQSGLTPARRRDILLLVFTLFAILALLGRGFYAIFTGSASFLFTKKVELTSTFIDSLGMFFCAAMLAPLMILCIRKLRGEESTVAKLPPVKFIIILVLFLIWAFALVIGSITNILGNNGWIISSVFFLLGLGLPVAAVIWIAAGGLPVRSWRRFWAAFGIGMTGSTTVALIAEYALVGMAMLIASLIAATKPEWLAFLQHIRAQITNATDMESLLTTIAPYLISPWVLILALLFAAVIAPLIEETLKPLAVWLVGKGISSPAEGFALGALCGAGFALLEGTLSVGSNFQILGVGLAARSASTLMHITASGILGWGIASARLKKQYGRLAGAYSLAIGIHGIWNGSVVLAVYGALRLTIPNSGAAILSSLLTLVGISMLGAMVVVIIILLPVINRRLRAELAANDTQSLSVIIAPPSN